MCIFQLTMAERDISDEVYHRVRQLERSSCANWPVVVQTIVFYRYPNAPPEFKITIVEDTNHNIIVIDESFEFTSMDINRILVYIIDIIIRYYFGTKQIQAY